MASSADSLTMTDSLVDSLYAEALVLADEARAWFDRTRREASASAYDDLPGGASSDPLNDAGFAAPGWSVARANNCKIRRFACRNVDNDIARTGLTDAPYTTRPGNPPRQCVTQYRPPRLPPF